jgi:hypothetical protein
VPTGRREAGWDAAAYVFNSSILLPMLMILDKGRRDKNISHEPDSVTAEIGRGEAKVLGDLP